MRPRFAVFGAPGSCLGPRLVEIARSRGSSAALLPIEGPIDGRPVTVRGPSVVWNGVDLLACGALLLELPLFPWPQPQRLESMPLDEVESRRRVLAEREARSLALSAISVAAETRPVWNRPAAAHLAIAPAIALDRLGDAGLPVQSWSLEPVSETCGAEGCIVLDAVGRECWHRPSTPGPTEPALVLEPFAGEVTSVLVIASRPAGARRFASADAWARGRPSEDAGGGASWAEGLAVEAAKLLELDIVAVHFAGAGGSPRILLAEAGPDLAEWDAALSGALAPALVDRLVDAGRDREG